MGRRSVRAALTRALLHGGIVLAVGAFYGVPVQAQEAAGAAQVSGTVTSAEDGSPLSGVSVRVEGTDAGTLTDGEGRYTLQVPSLDETLVFSLIGFAEQAVSIGGRTVVDVTLETEAVALDEVVVIGYGTQERRDLTGAVASVAGEEVAEVATPSVEQALQGKVAGVQVSANSGEPGAGAVVRIRGTGTLNDASPLYVVDGMLLDDIQFLNPNDIASVEVLKDASATAIYGSRGANGVIIITTKEGNAGEDTRFSFNAYAGTQSVLDPIDLVDAREYAMLANELAANQGLPEPYFENPTSLGPGTDWQDHVLEAAPIQSYQLSAAGGSDRITYYLSANLISQAGIVPKSDFNRFTLRLNNDYRLTDYLQVGHNINFSYTDGQRAPGVLGALYRADPTVAPRDEEGNFSNASIRASAGNPAATVFYTRNEEQGNRLVGNLFAEAEFLDNFTFRSNFGLDLDRSDYRSFVPEFLVSPTQQNETSDLRVETSNVNTWLWENTLNYAFETDRHDLDLLAGITAQSFYDEELGGERVNIVGIGDNLWYLNAGDAEGQTNFNSASDWRMLSYLFRTNYDFLDRYLFTASMRIDGSSRFGDENRYGYFPSLAIGWNLAEESFLQGADAVSALKLRASWGKIGNDKIGAYPGIPVVTGNLNAVFGADGGTLQFGASPIELANPGVQWEETSQTNVGADMAFFDDRLRATVDYYRRTTDGILVQVPIPDFVGVQVEPFVNAAEVRNSGIEGTFSWAGTVGDVGIQLGVNGATINNEVLALGGGREEILGGGLGNEIRFTTRTVPGHPIGAFWGYRVLDVFQTPEEIASSPTRGGEQPGDLRYADLSGPEGVPDGVINELDKTFIGSPIPDFVYGFSADLSWRSLDFSASFSGQAGNEIFNGKKAVRFGVENFEESYLDRWHGQGTSDTEPRVTNAGHNYQASDRFIEDGSYFKLQSATLGYTLPASITRGLNASDARIYVSGTNLFTLSDYSGYTPEIVNVTDDNPGGNVIASGIDLGVYPPSRIITAGINLTF